MANKVLLYADGAVEGLAGTNTNDVLTWNGTDWVSAAGGGGGGSGTVTSVAGSTGTSGLTISASPSDPITTSGTLAIPAPDVLAFDTTPVVAVANAGEQGWNVDEGTLDLVFEGGHVKSTLGQTLHQRVLNDTGSSLSKGQAVYVNGAQGNRVTAALAQADADSTSATILGLVAYAIADQAEGYVITEGLIKGVNTNGMTEGEPVYLSPTTPGALTQTKPVAPQHLVLIGYCVRADATVGEILIKTQNGYEIGELHDVYVNNPTSGQILIYDATVGQTRWENANLTGGTGVTVTPGAGSLSVAIGQDVGTASTVTFADITDSGLTASQYVKTDANKKLVSAATIPASDVTGIPYDIIQSTVGTYSNGEVVFRFVAKRAITLNSTASNHSFKALTASTGSVTVLVKNGATTLLSVAFSASATGVVTVSNTAIAVGDEITVVMPATADATLAGVYYTITGSV